MSDLEQAGVEGMTKMARSWRRPPNKDGSCFRCNGIGWVEVCGEKANPPDDGALWGVVRACWWCAYIQPEPEWIEDFFDIGLVNGLPWPRETFLEREARSLLFRWNVGMAMERDRIRRSLEPMQLQLFQVGAP